MIRLAPKNLLQEALEPFAFRRRNGSRRRGVILVQVFELGLSMFFIGFRLSWLG